MRTSKKWTKWRRVTEIKSSSPQLSRRLHNDIEPRHARSSRTKRAQTHRPRICRNVSVRCAGLLRDTERHECDFDTVRFLTSLSSGGHDRYVSKKVACRVVHAVEGDGRC